MKTAHDVYLERIRFAEQGDIARIKRLPVDYKALYGSASELEFESAEMMKNEGYDPSRRITGLRSAAALAYKAGNFHQAKKIIAIARAENPDGYEASLMDEIETAIQEETKPVTVHRKSANGHLHITGSMTAADADECAIKIRDTASSEVYSFIVPAKMFRSVVKTFLLEMVSAVGKKNAAGRLTLEKISPAA